MVRRDQFPGGSPCGEGFEQLAKASRANVRAAGRAASARRRSGSSSSWRSSASSSRCYPPRERADDVELQQERKLLTHAIIDRGRRVLRELENVAASNDIVLQLHYNFDPDWVHHLVGLRLATFFDHDHVFVVDRTDKLHLRDAPTTPASIRRASMRVRGELNRIIDLLRGRVQPRDDEVVLEPSTDAQTELNRPRRAQRLQTFMDRPAIVAGVVANLPGNAALPGRRHHAAARREISSTAQLLSDISTRFDLPNLRIVGSEPVQPERARLRAVATRPTQRSRASPGCRTGPAPASSPTVLPFMAIAFGGFALLTGLALRYIRRSAVKIAEGEDRLRHLALHDPLSGLPNRTYFGERLADVIAARRQGRPCRGGAGDRPRSFQGHQRHARPPHRRRADRRGGAAPRACAAP